MWSDELYLRRLVQRCNCSILGKVCLLCTHSFLLAIVGHLSKLSTVFCRWLQYSEVALISDMLCVEPHAAWSNTHFLVYLSRICCQDCRLSETQIGTELSFSITFGSLVRPPRRNAVRWFHGLSLGFSNFFQVWWVVYFHYMQNWLIRFYIRITVWVTVPAVLC